LSDKFLTVLKKITGMKSGNSGALYRLVTEHPGQLTVIELNHFLAGKISFDGRQRGKNLV
jgi:hypothetical protein